jgi:hypothetical protein
MHFSLVPEHFDHLRKEGYVEFEELLSPEECAAIRISSRGRFDIWRSHPEVGRIIRRRRLAECAADLFQADLIQLGFDQLLLPGGTGVVTLGELSPIQGIVGGLLIALTEPMEQRPLYPSHLGNGLFFGPEMPLSLDAPGEALLIAYASEPALYVYNTKSPHLHELKRYGYVFGDRLRADRHPVLVRRTH